jgi:hypothetical protein
MLRCPTVIVWDRYFNRRFWKNACPSAAYGNWYTTIESTRMSPERLCDAVSLTRGELFRGRNDYDGATKMEMLFHDVQAAKAAARIMGGAIVAPAPVLAPAPVAAETPVAAVASAAPITTAPRELLNVVAVWRKGWDVPNAAEYVSRLADGVKRNLSIPYQMTVLTDSIELHRSDIPCKVAPLVTDWAGWWAKVEIFRHDLFPKGPTLYLDLDTVVTGSLDGFMDSARFPRGIYFLDDFYHPGNAETGVMFWTGMDVSAVHRTFDAGHLSRNDAAYITGRALQFWRGLVRTDLQARMPIVSYKVHIRQGNNMAPPAGTSLVCFHGQPRPHGLGPDFPQWMKQHWVGNAPAPLGVVAGQGTGKRAFTRSEPRLSSRSERSEAVKEVASV